MDVTYLVALMGMLENSVQVLQRESILYILKSLMHTVNLPQLSLAIHEDGLVGDCF